MDNASYGWFLTNVVNNQYGKWPIVVGSANFDQSKFDVASVAGNIHFLYAQFYLFFIKPLLKETCLIEYSILQEFHKEDIVTLV